MGVSVERLVVAYEYPVYFTVDVFSPANPDFVTALSRKESRRQHRAFVVLEQAVAAAWPSLVEDIRGYARHHRDRLTLVADPLVVEGGEAAKNDPGAVSALHACMHAHALDRQSFVVIVGGGALLDVAGYAAATVHRGIRVVRVPTTVLSQNDSGVGVKNGINAFGKKNFLGTFAPPLAVLNDADFLTTLSMRDWRGGISEAIKVALLKDVEFFDLIEEKADRRVDSDMHAMLWLIYRCVQL